MPKKIRFLIGAVLIHVFKKRNRHLQQSNKKHFIFASICFQVFFFHSGINYWRQLPTKVMMPKNEGINKRHS